MMNQVLQQTNQLNNKIKSQKEEIKHNREEEIDNRFSHKIETLQKTS